MMQSLLMLALVGVLSVGLTACGTGNDKPDTGTNNNEIVTENGTNGTNGSGSTSGTGGTGGTGGMSGTNGTGGDLNNDMVGNADAYTNDNANTRARRSTLDTPNIHKSAYEYLNDGRYRASSDGNIIARKDRVTNDLTRGARDLIRDAGDAVKDAGREAGNAARDVGRAAENTLRDMTR